MNTTQRTCASDAHCLSRRAVLAAGGAAGVATLAACSGETEPSGEDTDTAAADTSSADAATQDEATSAEQGDSGAGGDAIANVSDVPVGGALAATTAAGEAVLLTQPTEGEIHAFSSVCTHRGCTVEAGEGDLSCPCHGSTFDLTTGDVLSGPADEPLPEVTVSVGSDGAITG